MKLKLDLVGALPLNDENYKFKTCAVVGNSRVLLKSKQGREIDEHEKVFRINYAPTADKKMSDREQTLILSTYNM